MAGLCEGGNEPPGSLKANKRGISSSEWTNAIKMSTNIAAVRSVPGRSFQDQNSRHPGCSEVETFGHVLGYCPKKELLRNNRHHKVRSSIATTLRKAKWEVYEEVHCLAENGSTRRADIIAIDRRNQRSPLDSEWFLWLRGAQSTEVRREAWQRRLGPNRAAGFVRGAHCEASANDFGSRGRNNGEKRKRMRNHKLLSVIAKMVRSAGVGFSEPTHARCEMQGPHRTNPDYTRDSEWFLQLQDARSAQRRTEVSLRRLGQIRPCRICARRALRDFRK
ncbi:hypothetical protein ANN_24444 [Periplaneta americana]|uniref:Uncharacterized protein n=1 Tax=Periplaneta americana TaxID=6978 RepID=A0ABQ8S3E2_PERAM|nr:hypothetical protein ANN_24444 [Periplaneta americana]